jgi:predicted enzyme related to lactoylglutathione lyase
MTALLTRLVLYTHDIAAVSQFYQLHFGYAEQPNPTDRIVELTPPGPGVILMLHPAAKGQKAGQAAVKLVFDVVDVAGFCADAAARGLDFGPLHQVDGYVFANAKDPSGNSISVSSRAFRIK